MGSSQSTDIDDASDTAANSIHSSATPTEGRHTTEASERSLIDSDDEDDGPTPNKIKAQRRDEFSFVYRQHPPPPTDVNG